MDKQPMTNIEFIILFILVSAATIFLVFILPTYIEIKKEKALRQYIKDNEKYFYDKYKNLISVCIEQDTEVEQLAVTFNNYIVDLGLRKTFHCSSNILNTAFNNEIQALLKYSDINKTDKYLEKIDFCKKFLNKVSCYSMNIQRLQKDIFSDLPKKYSYGKKLDLVQFLYSIDTYLIKYCSNQFIFSYTSPAGKSWRRYEITITESLLDKLFTELSIKANKENFMKSQRSAMTKDLREAIKQRDNYTCCKCGNSVLNEPNLLLEVDHIIPISKGGRTEANNLQTLCWKCNREKADNIE